MNLSRTQNTSVMWKPVFHINAISLPGTHLIGQSPSSSHFEVAIPPNFSLPDEYKDIPTMPPVVIMPDPRQIEYIGHFPAYTQEVFKFISNARTGILHYGIGLGQYYRERYPGFRSWIEYFILEYDIQVSSLILLA